MHCHESLSEAPECAEYTLVGLTVISAIMLIYILGTAIKDGLEDRARARRLREPIYSTD